MIAGSHPPVANSDSATTYEDTLVNIIVLNNDSDPDLDTLTTTGIISDPSNGIAALKADGTVDYTPNPDFNGQDSFVYGISDGNGGTSTATGAYFWRWKHFLGTMFLFVLIVWFAFEFNLYCSDHHREPGHQ